MKKLKIKDIIELWKDDKKQYVKKSTYSAYVLAVENHITPFFGQDYAFENNKVQNFILFKLKNGLSQKSVKDILVVLKMVLKFAVKNGYMSYIEINVKFPTDTHKAKIEVLTKNDYKKLTTYLQENFSFKNLGVYICLSTGMRIGEICGLKWQDVDLDNNSIKIERIIQRLYVFEDGKKYTEVITSTPKTSNAVRDIPINADLKKILKPLKRVMNDDYFIITNSNKPTEPRNYRNYFNNLLKSLNLQHIKFHALRHSFASRCIEAKCDYKTVSSILGHSNISTTLNLYVHPNLEQKKKCIDQMWKALK